MAFFRFRKPTAPAARPDVLFPADRKRRHAHAAWLIAAALTLAQPACAQQAGPYAYQNITTGTTTTLKSTVGNLHTVCVNTIVSSATITIYDNTAASGTKIGTITLPSTALPGCQLYDVAFWTGLTVVTSGATDITVAFH